MSNNFYQNVLSWAQARNIPKGAKAKRQRTKTWEELSETATGLAKSDLDPERMLAIKDAIGDCAVTTSNVANCMGLDSVRMGVHATEVVAARKDVFDSMDADDLLNCFVAHQAIVKTGDDDNSLAFLPFVINYQDSLVTSLAALEVLATRLGLVFEDCQDYAWNQIKDRKGMMINGTFVKEDNGEVEKSLQAIVEKAVDLSLEQYGHLFADGDAAGAMNDIWNQIRAYVTTSVGDTLNVGKSAMGVDSEKGTVSVTVVIDAYKQITVTTERQVSELLSGETEDATDTD